MAARLRPSGPSGRVDGVSPTTPARRQPPTAAQRRAAEPDCSIWVTASAGTGKTRVLADRVLRLLLEGGDPRQLLCLTFTKAAAAEMVATGSETAGRRVTGRQGERRGHSSPFASESCPTWFRVRGGRSGVGDGVGAPPRVEPPVVCAFSLPRRGVGAEASKARGAPASLWRRGPRPGGACATPGSRGASAPGRGDPRSLPARGQGRGVMGDRALGVTEIRPREGFYDYRAKYTEGVADPPTNRLFSGSTRDDAPPRLP